MEYVGLHPAFSWTCLKCATMSFVNGTLAEMDESEFDNGVDEVSDVRIDAIPDWHEESEDGMAAFAESVVPRVVIGPHKVACPQCGEVFLTQIEAEDE